MADRPSAREIALDAIDDAFKQAVTQFAKNYAVAAQTPSAASQFKAVDDGIQRAVLTRLAMIRIVAGLDV